MFTDDERRIFPYWNGEAAVCGDPLAVRRRLTLALQGGGVNALLQEANGADELAAAAATGRLVDAVRQAFEMAPFDPATGRGATEEDCRRALRSFSDFLEKKNQSTAS